VTSPRCVFFTNRVLFSLVKLPGRVVDHTPPPSAEVKERVELYLGDIVPLCIVYQRSVIFTIRQTKALLMMADVRQPKQVAVTKTHQIYKTYKAVFVGWLKQHFISSALKADSHSMPCPCCSHAMPCVNSNMPCRAPALLRQSRVLRESPCGSRKHPNC